MRAVVAGLVGNLVGWGCALAVWRQIVVPGGPAVAEDARRERARARAEELAAAAAAEAAAAVA